MGEVMREAVRRKEAMVKEKRLAWEAAPDFLRATVSAGAEARAARTQGEPAARLEASKRLKAQGSEKFRAGGYKAALRSYSDALSVYVWFQQPEDGSDDLPLVNSLQSEPPGPAHQHVCSLYLNLALCCLKIEAYDDATYSATRALEFDAGNAKALYFRAMANAAKETSYTLDLAVGDLEEAAKAKPGDRDIVGALKKCRAEKRLQDKKDRAAYGNIFKRQDGIGGGLYPEVAEGTGKEEEGHREPSPEELMKLIKKSEEVGLDLKDPAVWDEIERYRRQERLPRPIRYVMRHPYGALAYVFYGLSLVFAIWKVYKFIPTAQDIIREASAASAAASAPGGAGEADAFGGEF